MSCLIGVADEIIPERSSIPWTTNKIGGNAMFPDNTTSLAPSCEGCGKSMCLVVQLYCPLDGSMYHRFLYIYACVTPQCWNKSHGWLVYRYQTLEQSSRVPQCTQTEKQSSMGDDWGTDGDDWGADADDWGTAGDDWRASAEGWDSANKGTEQDWNDLKNVDDLVTDKKYSFEHQSRLPGNLVGSAKADSGDSDISGLSLKQLCVEDVDDEVPMATDHGGHVTAASEQAGNVVIAEDFNVPTEEQRKKLLESFSKSGAESVHETITSVITSYYLNVFTEPNVQTDNSSHIKKLLHDYETSSGWTEEGLDTESGRSSSKGKRDKSKGGVGGEQYEKTSVPHGDIFFHKFHKRLGLCPQQCIRYDWCGDPLYVSKPPPPTKSQGVCGNCGGDRVFELQLMPALVNFLHFPSCKAPAVEFGTVLVFTCRNSCWEDGAKVRPEALIVQPDPDQHRFV